MARVHVDSPATMPVPRQRGEAPTRKRGESPARKRQLSHPNGRRVRNVSLGDDYAAYLEELSDAWGMEVSTVISRLIFEQGQREDPPRNLPFLLR